MAAVCFTVVLTKLGYFVVYLVFFRIEFIHSRIVVAAMLPLSALIALLLREALSDAEVPGRKANWRMVLASFGVAVIVAVAIEAVAAAFGTRTISLMFASHSSHSENALVLQGVLARILLSLVVLAGLLCVGTRWRQRDSVSTVAVCMLAFLMVAQAFVYARSQVAGDHMRGHWPPFRSPTRLLANGDEFSVPTSREVARIGAALDSERFRTAFVCPPDLSGIYCPTHLAHFWKLRAIDGHLYAVPRRVAQVPWGQGAISLRALMFTDFRSLPWGLLGLYNVKYAIALSAELMTNKVRLQDGGARHVQPEDLTVAANPRLIAPRVFFARTITWVKDMEAASAALFSDHSSDKSV